MDSRRGRATIVCFVVAMFSAVLPAFSAERPASRTSATRPREHWAFQPISKPRIPPTRAVDRARTPIDAFVLKRLDDRGLSLSAPAARRDLIRRAAFDLLGVPPTPREIDQFVADSAPDAYEKLIERLLASPHYGESWGRLWLDLVRFAETAGYNADPVRPLAWRYRDYIVGAYNANVPYDRLVQAQLAGDELFPADVDAQVATGYLRMWPDESNASVVELARQDALNDLTGNVGSVFLGVSIGCAQCHDHKFDPIRQTDFYRLQAFFSGIVPADRAVVGSTRELADYRQRLDRWLTKTRAARNELFRMVNSARTRALGERRKRFTPKVLAAIDTPPDERTALQRQLFFWSDRQFMVSEPLIVAQMSAADRERLPALRKEIARLERARPQPPRQAPMMATTEVAGPIPPTFLLAGGSYDKPSREVQPGYLSVLCNNSEPAAKIVPTRPGLSGRRTTLAGWLTDPANPLVARVFVNRLWQGHFGRGLVENANDFGTQTPPPSNPELLDWLAGRFVASGWNIKAMHRLIMTSAVYRQATFRRRADQPPPKAVAVDQENRLYWHYDRRRLSAEQIRDAILAVSGRLDEEMGGPSVRPALPASFGKVASWKVTSSRVEQDRRSIYIFAKRNLPFPLLKAFDLPDMHESCARRPTTTIAPQALALINGEFVVGCGDALARRIVRERPSDNWDTRIACAYRLVFSRSPEREELGDAKEFLQTQSARASAEGESTAAANESSEISRRTAFADLCHALLNANEFLFLE